VKPQQVEQEIQVAPVWSLYYICNPKGKICC